MRWSQRVAGFRTKSMRWHLWYVNLFVCCVFPQRRKCIFIYVAMSALLIAFATFARLSAFVAAMLLYAALGFLSWQLLEFETWSTLLCCFAAYVVELFVQWWRGRPVYQPLGVSLRWIVRLAAEALAVHLFEGMPAGHLRRAGSFDDTIFAGPAMTDKSTQSMVTYTSLRGVVMPRSLPLGEQQNGAWDFNNALERV